MCHTKPKRNGHRYSLSAVLDRILLIHVAHVFHRCACYR